MTDWLELQARALAIPRLLKNEVFCESTKEIEDT